MPAALAPLAKKLKKALRRARAGDPKGVHAARTALRRLRVGLGVMGHTAFEPEWTDKLARRLRRVEQALGPTRDDDVFLADLDRWLKGVDGRGKAQAAPLRDCLRRRRARHARRVSRMLEKRGARAAFRRLGSFLRDPGRRALHPPRNSARADRTLVRHFLHGEVWRAYEEALAYDVRDARPGIDVIHKFRSACRRLRFTLELFGGAIHRAGHLAEPLHALQTRLGDLHDHALAVTFIDERLASGRLPRTRAIHDYRAMRVGERDRLAVEFERERRAIVARSFRIALFRALDGDGAAVAPPVALRLVPAA